MEKNLKATDGAPRLGKSAASLGKPVSVAANRPIRLDDPAVAWYVERGALDVFLVERMGGASATRSKFRAGPGRLVFGVGGDGELAAIAKGIPGSRLHRVQLDDLLEHDVGDALVRHVDMWLSEFSASLVQDLKPRPRPDLLLDPKNPSRPLEAEAGCVLSARPGGVVWIAGRDDALFLDTEDIGTGGNRLVPLTSDTWLVLPGPVRVSGVSSLELHREGRLLSALDGFHRLALGAEALNRLMARADEANEQTSRSVLRARHEERAKQLLFSVLESPRKAAREMSSALMEALDAIGKHEGIVFGPPPEYRSMNREGPSLQAVLNASGVRARKIRLTPEDRWWLGDSGAMLGFRKEGGEPVALLPGLSGRYRARDPVTGRAHRLDAGRAASLSPDAWLFYPPLPDDRPAGWKDVLRLVGKGMAYDIGKFVITGISASALTLIPAIATGLLVGQVYPFGSGGMLVQVVVGLVAFAVLGVMLDVKGRMTMMRLVGRASARATSTVWDRLLRLPASFFRKFSAGELATRLGVFQLLRDRISGVVANALLSSVFLWPALALLFVYDAHLAWTSLGIGLFSLAATAAFGYLQLGPQRRRYRAVRLLTGQVFQLIVGMGKLHSAGAEGSAFAAWARGYRKQHLSEIEIARLNEHLIAFGAAVPALAGAALFAVALWKGPDGLELGAFLVAYTVSMTFFAAVAGLGRSFEAIATIVPGYEQVEPILSALPDQRREDAGEMTLHGGIDLDHVSFRYDPQNPLIVEDVSIHVRPGEFVAIVGESGSGKSTLVRLMLGMETPVSGAISYDGRDLAHLDRGSVRRQIGVVMQDGALRSGDIVGNIIGLGGDLTIEDAERAARLARVDEDIAAMPMGMFTPVTESSGNFSGGQVQRIRIAAAIARDPGILILDEATSWVDVKIQAEIMRNIESLTATRVVIAHRLSTIRHAERICVLENGRIVQQGGFDDLVAVEGPFRELAKRQMA